MPSISGGYLFELSQFGFGKTDTSNSSEFYMSLMNDFNNTSDDDSMYDFWSNTSSLAMNFKGLGLPRDSYLSFANLLAVTTMGQSTCVTKASGYCVLVNPCEYYSDYGLWEYDFKI